MVDEVVASKAKALAVAIARAEGFFVEDSLPRRANNPGDMKLGDRGWGLIHGKTVFAKADLNADITDHADGWSALRRECEAILVGASAIYKLSDTFIDVAFKWTGDDSPNTWLDAVVEHLGVPMTTTLREFIQET